MKFERLKQFLDELNDSNIIPPSGMKIVIDDFEEAVPDHVIHIGQCEYNHRVGNNVLQVEIMSKEMIEAGLGHLKQYKE